MEFGIYFKTGKVEDGHMSSVAAWNNNKKAYVIYIDKEGKIHQALNNRYVIISSAVHEGVHQSDRSTAEDKNHIYAIIAQTLHSSFSGVPFDFKEGTANYAVVLLNRALESDNATIEDIFLGFKI